MSHLSATAVLIFALISISAALPAERRSRDSARFQDTRRPYLGREMIGRFQSYPWQYFGTTQQAKECSGGKVYDTCGSGCPPTCDNLSPGCTKECNAGCFCPEGLVDVARECVEPSVCHTVCSLPPKTGRCRARKPRFFYNATSAACELFNYGGCNGNGNKFATLEQCHARCRNYGPPAVVSPPSSEPPPKCPHLMEYNQCGTACPPTCENPNLIQRCTKQCSPGCFCPPGLVEFNGKCIHAAQCPNFCQHEPDAGVCKAKIPMFFHNATSGMCELFIYGGCGGNGNKFKTFHECYVKCVLPDVPVPRIIESPSIEGPKLSGGQTWINDKCNGLIIRTVDLSSGIFYGYYHQGLRPRYYVTGLVNPEASTAAFTVSWRDRFTNLLAVSAYSGHLQYLANGDKVFRSTYILTRKGRRMEIGSDVFYPVETAPPIGCPRAEGK